MCCVMCAGARLKRMPQMVTPMRARPTTIAMPATGIRMPSRSTRFAQKPLMASFLPNASRCSSVCAAFFVIGASRETGLELRTEEREEMFPRLLGERAILPLLERDAPRLLQVGLEVVYLARREFALVDLAVTLVCEAEGAAVEIGGSHRRPQAVDDEHLAVEHRRLVL